MKSNLDEVIYKKIIESLIRGEYKLGEKIQLNDICDKFEVSRTPVVQAVKMLNKDGVLQIMSNGRACVPEYELDMVKQVCESRSVIELYCLEKWLKGNEASYQKALLNLKKHVEQCNKYYQDNDCVQLAIADLDLHKAIVEGAENVVLTDLFNSIQGRFVVVNYVIHPLKDRDYDGTIKEHDTLLNLIEHRKNEEAIQFLRNHIEKTISRFDT